MNIKDFWKSILGGNKPYGIKISADGGTVTFQPGELNRFFEEYEKAKAENSRLDGGSLCTCSNKEKTGETAVDCCNICGKPTEEFWR